MTVKERVLRAQLAEKIKSNQNYATRIGVDVEHQLKDLKKAAHNND